ncbi:hypothetical protein HNY73_019110 [Argiope bruennichi]|uniref:Uncharacterized protein n=1 Tax=Argiope bruennichi TaxID=94029 RepID=A0A8T0EGF7_ARGBR|nr:hypothetical protein HNY73_019110 [Argiope bruennichi]
MKVRSEVEISVASGETADAMTVRPEEVEISVVSGETADAMKVRSEVEISVASGETADAMTVRSEEVEISVVSGVTADAMTVRPEEVEVDEISVVPEKTLIINDLGTEFVDLVEDSAQPLEATGLQSALFIEEYFTLCHCSIKDSF